MTYRNAKRGAAIAGAILFSMPLLDVFVGMATPGAVHVIVGTLGAMLVHTGRSRRLLRRAQPWRSSVR
jgi:hypothetical protein